MTGFRLKSIFMCIYMGIATWRVFYNVFLEENNFTGAEIGIINAILQSTIFLVVPLWGLVADRRGIRPTLSWLCIATAILMFFLGHIKIFWILLIYIPLLGIFHHPIGPLNDALAVEYSKTNSRYNYGKLRTWGSLGWGVASVLGGYLFLHISMNYVFPLTAILFVSAIFFLRIPARRKVIYKPDFKPFSLAYLYRNKQLFIFICILLLYGIASSPITSFLNLYFTELKANNKTIGYAYAIQAFSEVPFFIIGERLMRSLGAKRIIIISLAVMFVRMLLYGFIPSVTLGLALGVLQGITLSFLLVGVVSYIHQLLPEGKYAMCQSIIWGVYFGIGLSAGNVIMGYLKDMAGMTTVMWTFGILVFLTMILMVIHFKKGTDSQLKKGQLPG
jgi:PPP family 3-phenylpropionic acid transporter